MSQQPQKQTAKQPPTKAKDKDKPKNSSKDKEEERRRETAKAAQKSIEAQTKARELTQAAAACGDPDERQRLLNEALEKEVEAETFGKTAKYLQTGAFQGLCAGAGLGGGVGVSLGVVTGTLVGGTTSLVTGGLGAGLGLGVGAAHGPWFKVGDWMGKGIRKVTGDLPGWKATEEQKGALEKMINGVQEQDRPKDDELVQMTEGSGKVEVGKGYTGQRKADEGEKEGLVQKGVDSVSEVVPGMGSKDDGTKKNSQLKSKSKVQGHGVQQGAQAQTAPTQTKSPASDLAGKAVTPSTAQPKQAQNTTTSKPPQPHPAKTTSAAPQNASRQAPTSQAKPVTKQVKAQPAVSEKTSTVNNAPSPQASKARKPPKKLEVRSQKQSVKSKG